KGFMAKSDLVTVDAAGAKVSGKHSVTTEIKMHLKAYELRDDISAVVHAHPPYATAFALAGIPLSECMLPEVIVTLGAVPIARYATPSTDEVAQSVAQVVTRSDAVLLQNHGVMTVGVDAVNAYHKLEMVEHFAKIVFIARHLGRLSPLAHEEVTKLLAVREKLGIKGPAPTCRELEASPGRDAADRASLVKAIVEEVLNALREGNDALE
ncbi:MAG TPA: class II aldolase/adducin family protein, partial [bacterium]|nr:class II aldolase/adducin family protein [bacterium]